MQTRQDVKLNSETQSKAKILAPLDNMLWDRNLISELFGFEYRWEVYKPVSERKYGYYVLPVLYGNRFIARFEPERARKNQEFYIKNWWWEAGVEIDDQLKEEVILCLERFADYLGTRLCHKSISW